MNASIPGLETKNSAVAIFLTFFWPGLGQLYSGKVVRAVVMILFTVILYGFTWFVIGAVRNYDLQKLYNTYVEGYRIQGLSDDVAREKAWKEFKPLQDEWMRWFMVSVGSVLACIFWWAWGMVDARKLCERHNLEVFKLANPRAGDS